MRISWTPVAIVFLGWVCSAESADSPNSGRLSPCLTIDDDRERLDCYDRVAGRVASPQAKSTELDVTTHPLVARPEVADPVAEFGASESMQRHEAPSKLRDDAPLEQVTATVVAIGKTAEGRFVVTLDNSQQWVQSETEPRAIVRVGEQVTVKRASFGSYLLTTARNIPTRVRRIR